MLTLNSDKIKSDKWFSATYRTYVYEDDDQNDDQGVRIMAMIIDKYIYIVRYLIEI